MWFKRKISENLFYDEIRGFGKNPRKKNHPRLARKKHHKKNPQGKKPQGNKPPLDCQRDVISIKLY